MTQKKSQYSKLLSQLMAVHRRFLELERQQAEKHFERKINPFEFWQILTQDKNFEWLRPFSKMLADLDAYIDEIELTDENSPYITNEISLVLNHPKIQQRFETHILVDPDFAALQMEFNRTFTLLIK